jgi:hypothetical protein
VFPLELGLLKRRFKMLPPFGLLFTLANLERLLK